EGKSAVSREGAAVPAFLIDRNEVSNAQFLKFIAAGGYRDQTFWPETLIVNGKPAPWSTAGEAVVGPNRPCRTAALVERRLSGGKGRPSRRRRVLVRGDRLRPLAGKGAPHAGTVVARRGRRDPVGVSLGQRRQDRGEPRQLRSGRDPAGRVLPSRREPFRLLRHGGGRSGVGGGGPRRPRAAVGRRGGGGGGELHCWNPCPRERAAG